MADIMETQAMYKAHDAYAKQNPEWMRLALVVVNEWSNKEKTLAHAIATGMQDAYGRGERGDTPLDDAPIKIVRVRRTR